MLEYDNSAFYYFTLSLISIYLVPVTLVSVKQVPMQMLCCAVSMELAPLGACERVKRVAIGAFRLRCIY